MIRKYNQGDIEQLLDIWLSASIKAHDFIDPEFWKSKVGDMRDLYIPSSETYVFENEEAVVGFYCLHENSLAAIFVSPGFQDRGVGSILLNDAKTRRQSLQLAVYKENYMSVKFYKKHGFVVQGEQTDEHTGYPELIMTYHS